MSKVIICIHQWDGMVAWAANGAQGNSQTLCITAEVSWDLGFEGAVEPAPDASLDRLFRDGGGQFFFLPRLLHARIRYSTLIDPLRKPITTAGLGMTVGEEVSSLGQSWPCVKKPRRKCLSQKAGSHTHWAPWGLRSEITVWELEKSRSRSRTAAGAGGGGSRLGDTD